MLFSPKGKNTTDNDNEINPSYEIKQAENACAVSLETRGNHSVQPFTDRKVYLLLSPR